MIVGAEDNGIYHPGQLKISPNSGVSMFKKPQPISQSQPDSNEEIEGKNEEDLSSVL